MAAEVAAIRNSGGIKGRPGWLEGTLTTVRWAWGGSTKAPLEMPSTDTA
jgi:hypothetical protein